MDSKGRSYTILLIPGNNNGKTISIHCSRFALIAMTVMSGIFLLLAGFASVASFDTLRKNRLLAEIRGDNQMLLKENGRLQLIARKIGKLDTLASYLQVLAGTGEPSQPVPVAEATPYPGDESVQGAESHAGLEDSMPTTPPVRGWVTQKFSIDTVHRGIAHPGIDIAAAEGTPIIAAAPGTIIDLSADRFYGNMVTIDHGNGFITRYGHCLKIIVAKGQHVSRGQRIGLVGNTGHSSAPHLHYEVIKNGKNINPLGFIVAGKK